jgi:hypothetical protein
LIQINAAPSGVFVVFDPRRELDGRTRSASLKQPCLLIKSLDRTQLLRDLATGLRNRCLGRCFAVEVKYLCMGGIVNLANIAAYPKAGHEEQWHRAAREIEAADSTNSSVKRTTRRKR